MSDDFPQLDYTPPPPFLAGQPRVRYRSLETRCDFDDQLVKGSIDWNTYRGSEDGTRYYFNGQPFNGVAWDELRGRVNEDTMVEGIRHGRCVEIHPGGQLAKDGEFQHDDEIGEHRQWDETGNLILRKVHNVKGVELLVQHFDDAGRMTYERAAPEGDFLRSRTREFYDDGAVRFLSQRDVDTWFARDGNWAMRRTRGKKQFLHDYQDEVMLDAFDDLLESRPKNPTFLCPWLRGRLDKQDPRVMELVLELTRHPVFQIATMAMDLLGQYGNREAIHVLEQQQGSRQELGHGEGGFIGTRGERAKQATDQIKQREKVEVALQRPFVPEGLRRATRWVYAMLSRRFQPLSIHESLINEECSESRKSQEARHQQRRQADNSHWPETDAVLETTLTVTGTLQRGDQVLTNDCIQQSYEQWHRYFYVVNNRTYIAVMTSQEEEPTPSRRVRYQPERPEEYEFV